MIQGCDRNEVLALLDRMVEGCRMPYLHTVLFSGRRFKQRGARYRVVGRTGGMTLDRRASSTSWRVAFPAGERSSAGGRLERLGATDCSGFITHLRCEELDEGP